jgi:hypothetical protein
MSRPFSFQQDAEIVPFRHHLVAHGGSAEGAEVVVFVPVRKNKKEALPHRDGSPALGAEEFRGVEILVLFPFHSSSFSGILCASSSQTAASLSLGAR